MDRLHLRCKFNASLGNLETNGGVLSVLGNRTEPYYENQYNEVGGDAAMHGPFAYPFDDVLGIMMEEQYNPNYDEICDWLRYNPVRVSAVRISADRPETLKRLSVNVTRRTPFSKNSRQWIPLAGFLDQSSENNTSIKIPIDFVLDGFTTFDVKSSSMPDDDEYFDLIFEVSQVDDDRRHLS